MMRPRNARECNMTHARTHARALTHACTHARTQRARVQRAIVRVQSRCYRRGRTIHLPARARPRSTLDAYTARRLHYLCALRDGKREGGGGRGELERDRERERERETERETEREGRGVGGGSRDGTAERRGTENASATARILTRVARGPNSVTMRAARGIPRNTLNTSSSQKTNETTRPPSHGARFSLSLSLCFSVSVSIAPSSTQTDSHEYSRTTPLSACPNRPDTLVSTLASHPAAAAALAAKCRANVRARRNRGIRGSGTITSRMETRAAAERRTTSTRQARIPTMPAIR